MSFFKVSSIGNIFTPGMGIWYSEVTPIMPNLFLPIF
jgi:hypothetical protein